MDKKTPSNNILRYASLSTQWMVMLGISAWLGHKLDAFTMWRVPVFVITFPLIALLFSLWQLIKEVNK